MRVWERFRSQPAAESADPIRNALETVNRLDLDFDDLRRVEAYLRIQEVQRSTTRAPSRANWWLVGAISFLWLLVGIASLIEAPIKPFFDITASVRAVQFTPVCNGSSPLPLFDGGSWTVAKIESQRPFVVHYAGGTSESLIALGLPATKARSVFESANCDKTVTTRAIDPQVVSVTFVPGPNRPESVGNILGPRRSVASSDQHAIQAIEFVPDEAKRYEPVVVTFRRDAANIGRILSSDILVTDVRFGESPLYSMVGEALRSTFSPNYDPKQFPSSQIVRSGSVVSRDIPSLKAALEHGDALEMSKDNRGLLRSVLLESDAVQFSYTVQSDRMDIAVAARRFGTISPESSLVPSLLQWLLSQDLLQIIFKTAAPTAALAITAFRLLSRRSEG